MSEDAAAMIAARMEGARIYELLGIRLVAAGSGKAEIEVVCDERHANVDGAVHGGFLCLVADTAMGFAVRTDVEPTWLNRTVNLYIDWYAGAKAGDRVTARAEVDHASNRFRWAAAELSTDGGVICRARSLNSVRPPT